MKIEEKNKRNTSQKRLCNRITQKKPLTIVSRIYRQLTGGVKGALQVGIKIQWSIRTEDAKTYRPMRRCLLKSLGAKLWLMSKPKMVR